MVKSRKSSRRTQRKDRKGRKTVKGGRRTRSLLGRVYAPVNHALRLSKNLVSTTANTGKRIVGTTTNAAKKLYGNTASGLNRVMKSGIYHIEGTVRDVISRKAQKKTRKNRKH